MTSLKKRNRCKQGKGKWSATQAPSDGLDSDDDADEGESPKVQLVCQGGPVALLVQQEFLKAMMKAKLVGNESGNNKDNSVAWLMMIWTKMKLGLQQVLGKLQLVHQ